MTAGRTNWVSRLGAVLVILSAVAPAQSRVPETEVTVDWGKVTLSKSTPTLQVVVNPMLLRGAKMHDGSFAALHALGADYVRYLPWLPYPKQAVAEMEAPAESKTSWDFSHIDRTLDDFMNAIEGHSVIPNFSTIPAWMFKTERPVPYPQDPNKVFWDYTQRTELRDPSMKEVLQYFARLLSWYTKGGLTDENGKWHESGHHYKVPYWEVLNEIEFEHHWSVEHYIQFYDAVTKEMLKVDPQLKFIGLALAQPDWFPICSSISLIPRTTERTPRWISSVITSMRAQPLTRILEIGNTVFSRKPMAF